MRTIGELDSETKAQRFSDFLLVQGVANQIDSNSHGSWDIWVHSDDDLSRAGKWLADFRANPDDKQFATAAKANDLRAENERDLKEYQRRVKGRDNLFRRFVVFGVGPLTAFLICTCVAIAIWTKLGDEVLLKAPFLLFSEFYGSSNLMERLLMSPEIRSGQLWRAISPILLHYGWMHIIFNMLWLRDLGGMVETLEGTGKLLALVIVSAALSNYGQYVISGSPVFGGMSGVIYALLGYVWMKGKYNPGSGLYLHRETVMMMLIWLGVGFVNDFINLLPFKMANWAHLGGLVVGVTWGYLAARNA